jgi:hypothetical protein
MDIQVRFEDGTTEMRGEHTVCWVDQVITQTREDPIGQHRGKTVWIPSAGRNGRVETADEQIARLDADVASLRRQLADETTRASIAERTTMAWEERAEAWKRMAFALDARRRPLPSGTWERCEAAAAALVAIGEPNILTDYDTAEWTRGS